MGMELARASFSLFPEIPKAESQEKRCSNEIIKPPLSVIIAQDRGARAETDVLAYALSCRFPLPQALLESLARPYRVMSLMSLEFQI